MQAAPHTDISATADNRLEAQFAFLNEADRLKSVLRATTLCDGTRRENTAEHSWHVALYALVLADQAGADVNIDRVIKMMLLHDLVEIDVGDVPIHSGDGHAHHSIQTQSLEAKAADRIFALLPEDQAKAFRALWDEFEAAQTPDARFAKSLDRVQPVMANLQADGGSWRDYNVTYPQLEARVGDKIARGAPRLWTWVKSQVQAHPWFAKDRKP